MDFQGFRLDVERWRALAERNKAKQLELKAQLPFNPNSNPKSVEFYNKNGFKRIPNNQAETIEFFINKYPNTKAAECAKIALESKDYGHSASTYGMNFIQDFLEHESEGVDFILCNYWITGAKSGRMSADDPPMHQIPVRNTKAFRECFIARPNHKIVIIDWCQQEIGIQAFLAQDKKMMEIFNSGQSIYIRSAKEMLDKTITKSDPLYSEMKAVILGSDYGMSPQGLARKLNCSLDKAEELMNSFRKTYPQMYEYMDRQSDKKGVVKTVNGRKFHLNPYSEQCPRNAINSPTQGTGADMLKKSIARMHKEWKFDYPFAIVEVTHDEIGLDVPEEIAQNVADFTERIMVETANEMCHGMKFRVDKHITDNWAGAKT
jgi:DNA polymerase I-like protein with 3'-5' exonuclease and polymerase domains